MSNHFQTDREKLKEAVWLIADYCPVDELGNVKLHKILYYSDMIFFLREGRPITGEDYLKQKFGPTARHLNAVTTALKTDGKLNISESEYYGMYKKNYVPIQKYQKNRLSEDEIELIKYVTDFVRGKNAKEISEMSHNAAWEAAEMGEVIPYFAALQLVPVEITESDMQWAHESAKQYAHTSPN